MSNGRYIALGGVTHKVSKRYTVVNGITREIKKSYRVVNGVAREFYSSFTPVVATYTGNMTDTMIAVNGEQKRLLTFTSSGILTLDRATDAVVWFCDGGMKGGRTKTQNNRVTTTGTNGGMGGMFLPATEVSLGAGTHIITIGAGNSGETKFADLVATTKGSGGGRGYYNDYNGYTGDDRYLYNTVGGGVSTTPFGDSTNFLKLCAGGGGGGIFFSEFKNYDSDWNVTSIDPESYHRGGNGGSDGGDGEKGQYTANVSYKSAYGIGGEDGGGDGGKGQESFGYLNDGHGKPGTAYGAGGGGCATNAIQQDGYSHRTWSYQETHGDGYQGVVYVLLPTA